MKLRKAVIPAVLVLLLSCVCLLFAAATAEQPETGLENFIVRHGSPDSRKIAITMDDCTHQEIVWKTAELCRRYGITMTFFPNGRNLRPEDGKEWQKLLDAGCEIGSHGEDHIVMNTPDRIVPGLMVFQQHLDETLGYHYPVRWFRPPYGALEDQNGSMFDAMHRIRQCGYDHALLWNVSYMLDAKGAFAQTGNGSILLFHATDGDYRCLEGLIPMLLEAGFEPVTVSGLFGFELPAAGGECYVYDRRNFTFPRPDP